jgi:hypothetical protein
MFTLVTLLRNSLGKITQVLYYMEAINGLERQQQSKSLGR